MHWQLRQCACEALNVLLTFNALPTPYKCYRNLVLSYMHEYHSQHRVVTTSNTSFAVFLAKHVGKHSSGTFYVAFRDPGQILIIRDCPEDSGTVGAYGL